MFHRRLFPGLVVLFASALVAPVAVAVAAAPSETTSPSQTAAVLPPESEQAPPTDCTAPVGFAINGPLPGYLVPDQELATTCVPFTQVPLAPPGYAGDYRVQEFSDAAARRALAACAASPPCAAIEAARRYQPVEFRKTGTIVPEGRIDPHAPNVDLRQIRRPGFFVRAPYREPIAQAERHTYTFEFTVPAEPYERLNRGITTPVKLRGWYLKGSGVPNSRGRRIHSLVILIGGRTVETTAVRDPRDPLYTRSNSTGKFVSITYPSHGTELWGADVWREYLYKLNQAGFDVLTFDKRGHGISGGITADNTLQQGLDMLRAIDALDSGNGVRVLGPDGTERTGRSAVRQLVGPDEARRMPIVLGGSSQGSWTTQWAMDANFNRWCEFDLPDRPCPAPWGYRTITGAILLASLPGFTGTEQELPFEAARREILHIAFIPTSEPLAHIGTWPAALFVKGLWDEVPGGLRTGPGGGPFPTFNAYLRVRGMKELLYLRGPHSEIMWGPTNVALAQDRVVGFSINAIFGRPSGQPRYATLKEAVAASPPIWEYSTQPTFPSSP
jgi:pimeloyl-ACP methyl ester carboxylesterase